MLRVVCQGPKPSVGGDTRHLDSMLGRRPPRVRLRERSLRRHDALKVWVGKDEIVDYTNRLAGWLRRFGRRRYRSQVCMSNQRGIGRRYPLDEGVHQEL